MSCISEIEQDDCFIIAPCNKGSSDFYPENCKMGDGRKENFIARSLSINISPASFPKTI
jgi:hypothetical protein